MDQTDLDRKFELERDSIWFCLEKANYHIQQTIHELEIRLERIKSYLSKYERKLLEKQEKEETPKSREKKTKVINKQSTYEDNKFRL